jgi:hypothetical protein
MSLGLKLALIFLLFLAMIGTMMAVAFRERNRNRDDIQLSTEEAQASDERTLFAVFGLIIGGMLVTLLVAWLVFF